MIVFSKCPTCHADISFDETREFAFCTYCGTKVERPNEAPAADISRMGNLIRSAEEYERQGRIDDAIAVYNHILNLDGMNRQAAENTARLSRMVTEPNITVRRVPGDTGTIARLPVMLKCTTAPTHFPDRTLGCGETIVYTAPVGTYKLYLGKTGPSIVIPDRFTKVKYVCELEGNRVKIYPEL